MNIWFYINMAIFAVAVVFFVLFWIAGQKTDGYDCFIWFAFGLASGAAGIVSSAVRWLVKSQGWM